MAFDPNILHKNPGNWGTYIGRFWRTHKSLAAAKDSVKFWGGSWTIYHWDGDAWTAVLDSVTDRNIVV